MISFLRNYQKIKELSKDLVKLTVVDMPKDPNFELKVGEWVGLNKYDLVANEEYTIGGVLFKTKEIIYYFNVSRF